MAARQMNKEHKTVNSLPVYHNIPRIDGKYGGRYVEPELSILMISPANQNGYNHPVTYFGSVHVKLISIPCPFISEFLFLFYSTTTTVLLLNSWPSDLGMAIVSCQSQIVGSLKLSYHSTIAEAPIDSNRPESGFLERMLKFCYNSKPTIP
ncbi:hypothetical protein ACTXT7_001177 [Hymenolepis weldensis]